MSEKEIMAEGNSPSIILASTSPHRKALLDRLEIPYHAQAPGVEETRKPGETPRQMVVRLADKKARSVQNLCPEAAVIGSDQCAALDGENFGKPGTQKKAHRMLSAASGRTVDFFTAVTLIFQKQHLCHVDHTQVTFRELSNQEIWRYIHREDSLDCAGGFKCEGLGITLFDQIKNRDPTALVGLPLIELAAMLRTVGFKLP